MLNVQLLLTNNDIKLIKENLLYVLLSTYSGDIDTKDSGDIYRLLNKIDGYDHENTFKIDWNDFNTCDL